MKKVAIYIDNPIRSPYKNDQYDSFRSEGRYSLNIGFGLGLLGFDVNIIMIEWSFNKQINDNIYLSNKPIHNYYDYVLTWNLPVLDIVNFNKAIFMDWAIQFVDKVHQYINNTKKDIIYTNASKHLIIWAQNHNIKYPFEIHYLPGLFPIPSINVGFIPYNEQVIINKNKETDKELKVYLRYIKNSNEKYILKEQLIVDFFKNKEYKIKLNIHTNSRQIDSKEIQEITNLFKEYEINYLHDTEARYIDVINNINSSDICISAGGSCSGPIVPDIISLGKPLIFISDIIIDNKKDIFTNNLYEHPEELLYIQESNEQTIKKLEKFISNPKESYDKFKESFKDLDFNNWKEHAKKFFIN